jgi:hypothetical protein
MQPSEVKRTLEAGLLWEPIDLRLEIEMRKPPT